MAEAQREQEGAAANASASPASADSATSAVSNDLEVLRRDLEEANRRGQEYLSLAQRAQADFVNFRKRVEQERGESLQAGKAALALRILPVLDDFERALQHVPADLAGNDWVQGVELIGRKLRAALEAEGITPIEALGQEFNPWEQEAVMQGPSSPEEAGKVTEVFRSGYKLGSKVLRPAQVKVGTGP
jgi:molecular chaperone GrpE